MAIKQIEKKEERSKDRMPCPRCGEEAILIEAKTIIWLTCPKCKFKKLMKKEKEPIRVKPLIEEE